MVIPPPNSDNSPATPAESAQPDSDLTLNGATSEPDVDTVPDLRLAAEVDPTAAEPAHVDIYVKDEADRSWLARLRSLKASWDKEHRRRPHDEPVPVERTANVEKHLASLAALRDVCANIDQRLSRVEHVSEQQDVAAIDAALRDLCAQTYERLARIEAAVQRTEEAAAQKTLHEVCQNIDARLERTEETLHGSERVVAEWLEGHSGSMIARFAGLEETLRRTEEAVTDRTVNDLSQRIDARLERTEDTFRRSAGSAAESLQELSGNMTARFAAVEETLRLTPKSVADRMLPNIERQLMQARMALQRTEEAVTDKTLHELCQSINARLERTEDRLHRSEDAVAAWLQELSTRMTARFAEADETIQRIERSVSGRTVEQTFSPQPSGRVDVFPVQAEETAQSLNTKHTYRPLRLPWMAGLVVPVLVLVAALAISALIKTDRVVAPEKAEPLATIEQISTPAVPATNEQIAAPSTPTVMANAPRVSRERRVFTPPPQSADRESEPTPTRPTRFVGTLSITSVPSGALVSINGKPAGKTPLRLPRQRAGSLAVQVAHDGFERWSAAVLVPADQITQVNANLRASAR